MLSLALFGVVLLGAPIDAPLPVWIRPAGNHVESPTLGRERLVLIAPGAMPLVELQRTDPHQGTTERYKGFHLATLLERYAPPKSVDLALLRFANGVIIPVPFRDGPAMRRIDPFVARTLFVKDHWTSTFPPMRRGDPPEADARPLVFAGNKVVVADQRHPYVPPASQRSFSPWAHADTLVGIELVGEQAYLAQLAVGDDPRGPTVYREGCGFCHSVRGVGATLAPDLAEPVPLSAYYKNRELFHRVRSRPADAAARGLAMPPLPAFVPADANALRTWLRLTAERGLQAYKP